MIGLRKLARLALVILDEKYESNGGIEQSEG